MVFLAENPIVAGMLQKVDVPYTTPVEVLKAQIAAVPVDIITKRPLPAPTVYDVPIPAYTHPSTEIIEGHEIITPGYAAIATRREGNGDYVEVRDVVTGRTDVFREGGIIEYDPLSGRTPQYLADPAHRYISLETARDIEVQQWETPGWEFKDLFGDLTKYGKYILYGGIALAGIWLLGKVIGRKK